MVVTELNYFIALQVCYWQSNFLFGLTDVNKLLILNTVQGVYLVFFSKYRSPSDPSK